MLYWIADETILWGGWRKLLHSLAGLNPVDLVSFDLFFAPARHGAVLMSAAILFIGFLGWGSRPRDWFRISGREVWEGHALGFLVGFGFLSLFFLGLALTGLLYPSLLILGALAGAGPVLCRAALERTSLKRILVRDTSSIPRWAYLGLAPLVPVLVFALAPDTYVDTYQFYLAAPAEFLARHRLVFAQNPLGFQLPLAAELINALPLAVDDGVLPHYIQAGCVAAALILLGSWAARHGGTQAGWLAVILTGTVATMERQLTIAKNELDAAAFILAGFVCLLNWRGDGRGNWLRAGALLLGFSATVKLNGAFFLSLGGACLFLFRRAWSLSWVPLAVAPLAPWLAKSFLAMGDPVWPFLARVVPWALWEPESSAAMALYRQDPAVVSAFPAFLRGWVRWWLENQIFLALLLPFWFAAAWARKGLREGLILSLGGFLGLMLVVPSHAERMSLPVMLLAAGTAGVTLARMAESLSARVRQAALVVLLIALWFPLGRGLISVDPVPVLKRITGAIGPNEYAQLKLTTYWELRRSLQLKGEGNAIVLGDMRFFQLPTRCYTDRLPGRNWAWVLARECASPTEIRTRLKQMNCRTVIYNFVTEGFPHRWARAYPWSDRMLDVWTKFVGRHLMVAVMPRHVDNRNGGFCVYSLRTRPLARSPAHLPYLPGIESLYYEVTRHGQKGDADSWLAEAQALLRRFPQVDQVRNMVAEGLRHNGRLAEAYHYFRPGVLHGQVEATNHWGLALSAVASGRLSEAVRLIPKALEISPWLKPQADRLMEEIRKAMMADTRLFFRRKPPGGGAAR